MIVIAEAIVVEGRYDKNTLSQLVDAPIFETGGFGIMKNKKLLGFFRQVAETRGLIIFTDSDGAGLVIRNHLKSNLSKGRVLHAYIPKIQGKERRKAVGSKEGTLGVEGMSREVLLEALRNAGATILGEDVPVRGESITKLDLYAAGLSGGAGSGEKRKTLMTQLQLPDNLGANAFLDALNMVYTRSQFLETYNDN